MKGTVIGPSPTGGGRKDGILMAKIIAVVNQKDKLDETSLCDEILRSSSDSIAQVSGLYIDDKFEGSVESRAELDADAVERNAASLRILERAGFLPCGVRQGSFERDGLRLDILSFRLPAPEANASSAAYPPAEPELSMRKKRSGKFPERFSPLESGNGLSGP